MLYVDVCSPAGPFFRIRVPGTGSDRPLYRSITLPGGRPGNAANCFLPYSRRWRPGDSGYHSAFLGIVTPASGGSGEKEVQPVQIRAPLYGNFPGRFNPFFHRLPPGETFPSGIGGLPARLSDTQISQDLPKDVRDDLKNKFRKYFFNYQKFQE